MGMFNYVNYKTKCPVCSTTLNSFQTKSGRSLTLITVEPYDVPNFYDYCNECKAWIEYTLIESGEYEEKIKITKKGEVFKYVTRHIQFYVKE